MTRLALILMFGGAQMGFARDGILRLPLVQEIQFDEVVTGGTACHYDGSLNLSVQNGILQVDFTDFSTYLRRGRLARATCLFSATVHWPEGTQMVVSDLTLNGFSQLDGGATGMARAEIFTTGSTGQVLEIPLPEGAGLFQETLPGETFRSGCGGSGLLRMNSSLRVIDGGVVRADSLTAAISLEDCP